MSITAYASDGYAEVERACRAGEHELARELLAFLMVKLDGATCTWADGFGRCPRAAVNRAGRCREHLRDGATERRAAARAAGQAAIRARTEERARRVLPATREGRTAAAVARDLGVTRRTVERHRARLRDDGRL